MNCHIIRQKLNSYLDGELSPEEAARVESHLADCEVCERLKDEFVRLNEVLGDIGDEQPSAGFAARVRAAAEERHAARS